MLGILAEIPAYTTESFLNAASLQRDEEGWGGGFGAVSGVGCICGEGGDCISAAVCVQFKSLAPYPVVLYLS